MILGFDFQQVTRVSRIMRWAVVDMTRDQSVAEHSFNVSVYCKTIAERINDSCSFEHTVDSNLCAVVGLLHDLPEVVSGDTPALYKTEWKSEFEAMENKTFPAFCAWWDSISNEVLAIAKIADLIDAIQFAQKWCVDERREAIIYDMAKRLDELVSELSNNLHVAENIIIDPSWINLKIA